MNKMLLLFAIVLGLFADQSVTQAQCWEYWTSETCEDLYEELEWDTLCSSCAVSGSQGYCEDDFMKIYDEENWNTDRNSAHNTAQQGFNALLQTNVYDCVEITACKHWCYYDDVFDTWHCDTAEKTWLEISEDVIGGGICP